MRYNVLAPFQAIGTIDRATYLKYSGIYKRRANQHVGTLIVPDYEIFRIIRNEYKESI